MPRNVTATLTLNAHQIKSICVNFRVTSQTVNFESTQRAEPLLAQGAGYNKSLAEGVPGAQNFHFTSVSVHS